MMYKIEFYQPVNMDQCDWFRSNIYPSEYTEERANQILKWVEGLSPYRKVEVEP